MDNLSKMSDCQLWKRKSLCMVIFSRSQRNVGFFFAVEYLKLKCKEVWQEMIMGHKTRVIGVQTIINFTSRGCVLFKHKDGKAKKELIA